MPEDQAWQPLTRAEFHELERDQHLRDRRGRVWTVHVAPHERGGGLTPRRAARQRLRQDADERFADVYGLVAEAGLAPGELRLVIPRRGRTAAA